MINTFCMLNLGCFGHERKNKRKKGNWRFRGLEWVIAHFDSFVATDFPAHFESFVMTGFPGPCVAIGFSMSRRGGAIVRTNARDRNVATCMTVVHVRTRQGFLHRPSASEHGRWRPVATDRPKSLDRNKKFSVVTRVV